MSDTAGDFTQLRREYVSQGIADNSLVADPFQQFTQWFDVACQVRPDDATSMTLATANKQGMPSARIVLLKHFDADGFAWYTDYQSQKGQALAENPQAEILFYWYGLERQIRIQGRVEKLTVDQADIYFHQRPLGSQLSAAASEQSQPVASRQVLEERVAQLQAQFTEQEIPCPQRWGGYRLIPEKFEFWQGRENRLHDRFQYRLSDNNWIIERLQP
ncbi:pyridoxamine 5'-phosphate oxidase [Neptunomonas qingdaonensis]|uniref:Pyridoxine/pyridoxamine 5'-phosphate oxidase n=1 Tax=Neptunomonas qingdaonensis TaxID=1045558 RepID=A0A1I2U6T8_9GAMM|nr:pyridoxamine 5'-phosphate oxidase [Neptunomonas qingdaonensis]SFG72854.1 Pyridoxamine 5'-phosphate oxidase [Neptunomonas qingdaonensis]